MKICKEGKMDRLGKALDQGASLMVTCKVHLLRLNCTHALNKTSEVTEDPHREGCKKAFTKTTADFYS